MIKRIMFSVLVMILIMWVSGCRSVTAPPCYDTTFYTDTTCKECIQVMAINPCGYNFVKIDSIIVR